MFYRNCDHYYNDELYLNTIFFHDNIKECFICLENETNKNDIIKLCEIKQIKFTKKCACDGFIHVECLKKWCNLYKKCPICRKNIEKWNLFTNKNNIYINFYRFYFLLFYKMIYFFTVISFFYSIYIFYDSMLVSKKYNYRQINSYHNDY